MSDEKVVEPPRRGRPKVDEPLTSISIRLPMSTHDRLAKIAHQRDESLSSLVRTLLVFRLR